MTFTDYTELKEYVESEFKEYVESEFGDINGIYHVKLRCGERMRSPIPASMQYVDFITRYGEVYGPFRILQKPLPVIYNYECYIVQMINGNVIRFIYNTTRGISCDLF